MLMNAKCFITLLIIVTLCKSGYNYNLRKSFIRFTKASTLNINCDNNNQKLNANSPSTIIATPVWPTTIPQPTHAEPAMNMSDHFRYDMKKSENYSEIAITLSGNIDIGNVSFYRSKDTYTISIPFTRL
ncbi:7836_t:CDS:1 [Dentiscutata erythropus]|uniref:7836_t:CDS:1 n=1 Tax=Dentiscutata erythropus TaxID=1348616 RepID=A0A9N9ESD9_9GLOM|nr:7836_t:CDS:1 [Dentiscutata erythropus]